MEKPKTIRCAVYTRKSVEEGLEMEFNSLDAQRLAAENYIASQKMSGWVCLPDRYDDGGFSGGTLDRPAMQRLMADAEAGKFDLIVVYKIDRLSRSIMDFADLSRKLDAWGVSFVSVTQDINTSTSSGRMMLNILMTFAQYEREVIAERIRDKMSASRKRGQWVGGTVPFGYKVEDKKLKPDFATASVVTEIFRRYADCASTKRVAVWLNERGIKTKRNGEWKTTAVADVLKNHTYIGEVAYQGGIYKGEHEAILDRALWDEAQAVIARNYCGQGNRTRAVATEPMPLKGLIRCGHCDGAMSPGWSTKGNKRYTYYVCKKDERRAISTCPLHRISAGEIEAAVIEQVGVVLRTPEFVALVAKETGENVHSVMESLADVSSFWEELYPAERHRLLRLLVDHVTVKETGIELELKTAGMKSLIEEVQSAND